MSDSYWLNKLFFDTQNPLTLARLRGERASFLAAYSLSASAQAALATEDVAALWQMGVNPYLLRFYCRGIQMPEDVYLARLRSAPQQAAIEPATDG